MGGVGHVRAEGVVQGPEDVVFALEHKQVYTVVIGLERDLHVLIEEAILVGAHGLEQLHVLNAAVDHRAAVGRDDAVGKVEAAFDRALEQGAGWSRTGGSSCNRSRCPSTRCSGRAGARRRCCPDSSRVRVCSRRQRRRIFAFCLGLDNKCVVGLLQEVLEVGQVLQVSHCCIPPFWLHVILFLSFPCRLLCYNFNSNI